MKGSMERNVQRDRRRGVADGEVEDGLRTKSQEKNADTNLAPTVPLERGQWGRFWRRGERAGQPEERIRGAGANERARWTGVRPGSDRLNPCVVNGLQ